MQPVLIDVGLNRRDLGDLVPERVGVVTLERGTTPAAVGRLDLVRVPELFGWDESPGVAGMSWLAATLPPGGRCGRPPLELDRGRVGRGRLGGVGGVLAEPDLQIRDPLFQGDDDGQDGRLGFRRHGLPKRFGDRRVRAHTADTTSLLYKEFEPVNAYAG